MLRKGHPGEVITSCFCICCCVTDLDAIHLDSAGPGVASSEALARVSLALPRDSLSRACDSCFSESLISFFLFHLPKRHLGESQTLQTLGRSPALCRGLSLLPQTRSAGGSDLIQSVMFLSPLSLSNWDPLYYLSCNSSNKDHKRWASGEDTVNLFINRNQVASKSERLGLMGADIDLRPTVRISRRVILIFFVLRSRFPDWFSWLRGEYLLESWELLMRRCQGCRPEGIKRSAPH